MKVRWQGLSSHNLNGCHKRVAGLGKGTMTIADDFGEPLPDSFWVDEE
jgi:hypothetical protein